jgi:lipoic acid synthetase
VPATAKQSEVSTSKNQKCVKKGRDEGKIKGMIFVVEQDKKHAIQEKGNLRILDCGIADYRDVLELQQRLCEQRRDDKITNTVLIVEHRPVITLGARQKANKLLVSRDELEQMGIDVVDIRRGGGVTAHNPGQIVFYPILNLAQLGLGISEYIRELEAIGIELLRQLGVMSERRKGFPGLWTANKKIASIGVRVARGVTHHGMAINIQNDLSIFYHIIPCGLDEVEMTSVLKETGERKSMYGVKEKLIVLLREHFGKIKIGQRTKDPTSPSATPWQAEEGRKLPSWLKRPLPTAGSFSRTEDVLKSLRIETICDNANCPNRGECWERGTATVLILGNICTRRCKFCSVNKGKPKAVDTTEPARIAEMAKKLNLRYLVITSVNRDDLTDGGAGHFRDCIHEVRSRCPDVKIEILTPDFRDCQKKAIEILATEFLATEVTENTEKKGNIGYSKFVFAHNVEIVPSLYKIARAGGNYHESLNLLKMAKETLRCAQGDIITKSSIMLGLGETDEEIEGVLRDLRSVGCDRITIGQYLKPSRDCFEVVEYVRPEKFDWWKQKAIELGFEWIICEPFARSSYFAEMPSTQSAIMMSPFTGE